MTTENRQALLDGIRDGVPIGLGYLVVSFTLGITAKHAGLDPVQGFFVSFLKFSIFFIIINKLYRRILIFIFIFIYFLKII